jgi:hypothetical protein
LRDQLSKLDEVGVENAGGVLGDVHVISAGVGDSIGARTALAFTLATLQSRAQTNPTP